MSTVLIVPSGKALPVQYSAVAPVEVVPVSTPTNLTKLLHHGKILNLNPGAALTINLATAPVGTIVIVVNNTGADFLPTLTGFTQGTLRNALGWTKIQKGGMATLVVNSPDGGATNYVRAVGELA